jgi:hypothetical protein
MGFGGIFLSSIFLSLFLFTAGLEQAESPANLQTQHETIDPILPRCLAGAGGRLPDWERGLQSFTG